MAQTNITWPKSLPPGLQAGREYRRQSPNQRSQMATGRSIQRRKFPSAPWFADIAWLMTGAQAQAFQAWARDVLNDCNYWFLMPLKTPMGYNLHAVRIVNHYSGPSIAGPDLWNLSAEVEFDKEPLAPIGDGEYPDEIAYSELFDITMNEKWVKR
jgi:hypothetical protein